MRAWTHHRAGPPSTVLQFSTLPIPTLPTQSSVLVHITYASLAPGGSIMMQCCPAMFRSKPCIPELDFSGDIVVVGDGVPAARKLNLGDRVFGSVPVSAHLKGAGVLAEYVAVESECVIGMPIGRKGWEGEKGMEKGAAVGVSGATAVVAMDEAGKSGLKSGMRVLVNGASGGIGHLVIQLAKKAVGFEGKVFAICSRGNAEMVKSLGADEVIDYTAHASLSSYLKSNYAASPFDIILDCYGVQPLWSHCASYLSPHGAFVSVGVANAHFSVASMLYASASMLLNSFRPMLLGGVARPYVCVQGFVTLALLDRLRDLIEKGNLDIVIDGDQAFEIGDVQRAYEKMLGRHARGKIVVKV